MRRELRFVTPIEALIYFRTLPLFGDLPPSELALVCNSASEQQFPRGRALFTAGAPADAIHVIVEGTAEESRAGAVIGRFTSGQSVGVAAMMSQDQRGIEVTTRTSVTTLRIDRDALERLFGDHFSIYHHVLRAICRSTREERRELGDGNRQRPDLKVAAMSGELDLVGRLIALRHGLPFAARHAVALGEIASRASEARFEPDRPLWCEGEPADDLVVVLAGRVSCHTARGVEFEIGPGGSCGFADAIAERARSHTAHVGAPTRGLRIHRETLLDALENYAELAESCLAVAAAELFDLRSSAHAEDAVVRIEG